MKVRDDLVEWLCQIDPASYTPYVVVERKAKVLYLQVTRAIYGMVQAGLFWYRKLQNDLEEVGFVFNNYDPCVANWMKKGDQHKIRYLFRLPHSKVGFKSSVSPPLPLC